MVEVKNQTLCGLVTQQVRFPDLEKLPADQLLDEGVYGLCVGGGEFGGGGVLGILVILWFAKQKGVITGNGIKELFSCVPFSCKKDGILVTMFLPCLDSGLCRILPSSLCKKGWENKFLFWQE